MPKKDRATLNNNRYQQTLLKKWHQKAAKEANLTPIMQGLFATSSKTTSNHDFGLPRSKPEPLVQSHTPIAHFNLIGVSMMFLVLLPSLVRATTPSDISGLKSLNPDRPYGPLDLYKCYPITTNLFWSIHGDGEFRFLDLYVVDGTKSKTSDPSYTRKKVDFLRREEALTFFSKSSTPTKLIEWLEKIEKTELADRIRHPEETFLNDIKRYFKRAVSEGEIWYLKEILAEYPTYKKELLKSVTLTDLIKLKESEASPRWEYEGVGGCRDDDDNNMYGETGHLCQKWSRIPTKGAYLQIMDLLSSNLDIENEGHKTQTLKL